MIGNFVIQIGRQPGLTYGRDFTSGVGSHVKAISGTPVAPPGPSLPVFGRRGLPDPPLRRVAEWRHGGSQTRRHASAGCGGALPTKALYEPGFASSGSPRENIPSASGEPHVRNVQLSGQQFHPPFRHRAAESHRKGERSFLIVRLGSRMHRH
jgi:hypothetical protein